MELSRTWAAAVALGLTLGCVSEGERTIGAPSPLPAGFQRGLSLGNRLDAPFEGAWGPPLREGDFKTIAERGFDHVRLPVRFGAHAMIQSPYRLEATFMNRVDWAMEAALAQGLSVVLDFQYYDELMSEPAEHRARFIAIWAQLAERYVARSERVAFELLSNPSAALGETYAELVGETVAVLRRRDPKRLLIVNGPDSARPEALADLVLPRDPHLVASAHVFGPDLFTLQGVTWLSPEYLTTGVLFPGPPSVPLVPVDAAQQDETSRSWFEAYNTLPSDENPSGPSAIERTTELLLAFRERTGYDVYVGELGTSVFGDTDSRTRYLELLRASLESRNLGWAVWDNNGNDLAVLGAAEGTWRDSTIDALIPAASGSP